MQDAKLARSKVEGPPGRRGALLPRLLLPFLASFVLLILPVAAEESPLGLVDWLRAHGEDASFAARRARFGRLFPDERYRGEAEQNMRLLRALRAGPTTPARGPAPAPGRDARGPLTPAQRTVVDQGWRLELDLTSQVLRLSTPVEKEYQYADRGQQPGVTTTELPLEVRPPATSGLVSAALLGAKAKQFDDGLYAAVERAAQPWKQAWLYEVKGRLSKSRAPGDAAIVVRAACELGTGWSPSRAPKLEEPVERLLRRFEATPRRSKPLGFYTWSDEYRRIFRQDRMLQTPIRWDASAQALVALLRERPTLQATYVRMLELAEGMTNPFPYGDLRVPLGGATPKGSLHLLPPSRSHEVELFKRLWPDGPPPDDANLMDELVDAVRAGRVSLRPQTGSGWYDHQTWALDPFLRPEATPEADRLRYDATYRAYLEQLFRGLLALTRETHVKQLEMGVAATACAPPVRIHVTPGLTVEPQITHYTRRADAYAFVRGVIDEHLGAGALATMHRQTADGPVTVDLDTELRFMERLFRGAAEVARREIGSPEAGIDPDAAAAVATFEGWRSIMRGDPDLARDARMMVPVFYDPNRKQTKVWAFLGWVDRSFTVTYEQAPDVRTKEPLGDEAVRGYQGSEPEITFAGQSTRIACPVMAEVYVTDLMDRKAFRAHCDRYKTRTAILANLR